MLSLPELSGCPSGAWEVRKLGALVIEMRELLPHAEPHSLPLNQSMLLGLHAIPSSTSLPFSTLSLFAHQ